MKWFFVSRVCFFVVVDDDNDDGNAPFLVLREDLGRALVAGGVGLFAGEESGVLRAATAAVRPPLGAASWEAVARGCNVGRLTSAFGWLRELFEKKYAAHFE